MRFGKRSCAVLKKMALTGTERQRPTLVASHFAVVARYRTREIVWRWEEAVSAKREAW
jgi:hypothetical protein